MAGVAFERNLRFAINVALNDRREAPWYGAWSLVLTQQLFKDFCKPPFFTITFPQYPLSQEDDTKEDDLWESDPPEIDDTGNDMQPAQLGGTGPSTPTKPRAFIRDVTVPSPQEYNGPPHLLLKTPPPALRNPAVKSPSLSVAPLEKKSTRIPDFAQIVYKELGQVPLRYESSILLIVEIKKFVLTSKSGRPWNIYNTLSQTDEQAYHAFKADKNILLLGAIIAIGDHWTYREYNRVSVLRHRSPSADSDASYRTDRSENESVSYAETYDPMEKHFTSGFAVLMTEKSDAAFGTLRLRMETLNTRI